jgi:hypothetical protein
VRFCFLHPLSPNPASELSFAIAFASFVVCIIQKIALAYKKRAINYPGIFQNKLLFIVIAAELDSKYQTCEQDPQQYRQIKSS